MARVKEGVFFAHGTPCAENTFLLISAIALRFSSNRW